MPFRYHPLQQPPRPASLEEAHGLLAELWHRILSVVQTCTTQARSVHDFLTELFQADYTGRELASLA
jgi:hypothetical protein